MAQYSAEPAQSSQRPRQSPELGLLATPLAWLAALRERAAPLLGRPHGHAIALGGLGDTGNAPHLRVPHAHVGVRSWGAAHHPLTTGGDTWLAGADGNHVSDLVTMGPGRPHPGAIGPTPPGKEELPPHLHRCIAAPSTCQRAPCGPSPGAPNVYRPGSTLCAPATQFAVAAPCAPAVPLDVVRTRFFRIGGVLVTSPSGRGGPCSVGEMF